MFILRALPIDSGEGDGEVPGGEGGKGIALGSSCTGVIVYEDDLVDSGSAILCGATGGGRIVEPPELVDSVEKMESKEGTCRKCGASRHLTSGALISLGVRRRRIGDNTRRRSGDLARSLLVTISAAGVRSS